MDEIALTFDIPATTLRDWSKKESKKNKLFRYLETVSTKDVERTRKDKGSKKVSVVFSPKAKSVKLDKSWFSGDLLWSYGDGKRIGIDHLIVIYILKPYQRNTDKLVKLFGKDRVARCIQNNLEDPRTKNAALLQLEYACHNTTTNLASIGMNRAFNSDRMIEVMRKGSQKQIDHIYNRIGAKRMVEIAKLADTKFVSKTIIQKVKYAEEKSA